MMRAVRLVVDTGLHSLKWTRQQAIEFLTKYSSMSQPDVEGKTNMNNEIMKERKKHNQLNFKLNTIE